MRTWPVLLCAVAILMSMACAPNNSYEVAGLLFEEIATSESPFEHRVLADNWRVFDVIGATFRENPDTVRCYNLFSTFLISISDPDGEDLKNSAIRTTIEYSGNLLTTVPTGGIIIVGGIENYYYAKYARAIHGRGEDIAIVSIDLLRFGEYRRYLDSRHGITIPKKLLERIGKKPGQKLFIEVMLNWFIASSDRPVYLDMSFPPSGAKNSVLLGPGRLYIDGMTDEEYKSRVFDLYSKDYRFDEVNKFWDRLPVELNTKVQTYGDVLPYIVSRWFPSDTAAAESLTIVALERLPHHWQPVKIYLVLNPELSEQKRIDFSKRVIDYNKKYPGNRNVSELIDKLGEEFMVLQ